MKAQDILIGLVGIGVGAYIFNKEKAKKIISDITSDEVSTSSIPNTTGTMPMMTNTGGSNIADIPMTTPIKIQNDFGNTPLNFITEIDGSKISFYRDLTNAYKRYFSTAELGATSPISITQEEYVKAYQDYMNAPSTALVSTTIETVTT